MPVQRIKAGFSGVKQINVLREIVVNRPVIEPKRSKN